MNRKVIYAGSFDPFTVGHLNMVLRSLLELNAEQPTDLIVAVGNNEAKSPLLGDNRRRAALVQRELVNVARDLVRYDMVPLLNEEEKQKLKAIITQRPEAIQTWAFDEMLIDFALEQKADLILRGVRSEEDLQAERKLMFYNDLLLETRIPKEKTKLKFLLKKQEKSTLSYVSSSAVKTLCEGGNFATAFSLLSNVSQQAMARVYLSNCLLRLRSDWGKSFMEMNTLLGRLMPEDVDTGLVTPVDCLLAFEYLDRYIANHQVDNMTLLNRAIVFSLDTAQDLIDEQPDAEDLRPLVKILRKSMMNDTDLGRISDDAEVAVDALRAKLAQPKLCVDFFMRNAHNMKPDEFKRFYAQWTGSGWWFFTDYFDKLWTAAVRNNLCNL